MKVKLPAIAETPAERIHYEMLTELARQFGSELSRQSKMYAVKGGTGLKTGYGLTRPSTDIDIDTEDYVDVRNTIRSALRNMPRYQRREIPLSERRIGYDDDVALIDTKTGIELRTNIDCTMSGTFPGDTRRLDRSKIVMHNGVSMWSLEEMARRKLAALIGPANRHASRDVYDAAWLVTHHRGLIGENQIDALNEWLKTTRPETAGWREWNKLFDRDTVTGRVRFETVMKVLEEGLRCKPKPVQAPLRTAVDALAARIPTPRERVARETTPTDIDKNQGRDS